MRSAATFSGLAFIPSMYAAGSPGTTCSTRKTTRLATARLRTSEAKRVVT